MPPAKASLPAPFGGSGRDPSVVASLPRVPAAARRARHVIKKRFNGMLAEDTLDDVLLVVSELVTNAVLHGEGDIELHIAFDGKRVTGAVTDEGIRLVQQLRDRSPDQVGGRGLLLVERIADSWGLQEGSSHVWFELLDRRQLL